MVKLVGFPLVVFIQGRQLLEHHVISGIVESLVREGIVIGQIYGHCDVVGLGVGVDFSPKQQLI